MTTHSRLAEATRRLIRTVDGLSDEKFAEPSLLPDWTRAHVVAHLVLNAEGMGRALAGVLRGEIVPVYDSNKQRDTDVATLGADAPGVLRERLLAATTYFAELAESLDASQLERFVHRTPDGQAWPAGACLAMRELEVEVHHADLGCDYTADDWPMEFGAELLERRVDRLHALGPMRLHATDLSRDWTVGEGVASGDHPTMSGPVGQLGWWATGRGAGEGLEFSAGDLPPVVQW